MKTKLKINLDRANVSTSMDMFETMWNLHQQGLSWGDTFSQLVAEKAIERYQVHIAAAFERYGIQFEPGAPITVDVLLNAINQKTGLEIPSLTHDGIVSALDGKVSGRMSEVLGVDIASVQNIEAVKQMLIDSAKQAVISGRATKLITKGVINKIRARKACVDNGLADELERKKVFNRAYQKKYRRTHKEVWIGSKNDPGDNWNQDMYNHRGDT